MTPADGGPPGSAVAARGALLGRGMRAAVAAGAVLNFIWCAGYIVGAGWATWPWDTGRLSHLFVASMLAAIGAGAAWIAYSGEAGPLPAGFLNLTVALGGIAVYLLAGGVAGADGRLGYAAAALAVLNLALFAWSLRWPTPRGEPLPPLVRGSYVVFAIVLLVVGVLLIRRTGGIMPWPVDADTSVVFGWIFFGDAWYFAYAAAIADWNAARSQLWSFLGYDAVLLLPLLLHTAGVPAELRNNLLLYLAVLVYSTALGVYYLVVNPRTRGWPRRATA